MGLFSKVRPDEPGPAARRERERARQVLVELLAKVDGLMEANITLHTAIRGFGDNPTEESATELARAAEAITDIIQPISDRIFEALHALGPVASE